MRPYLYPVLVVLAATSTAHAQYFEARNNGMGGVGAASSHYLAAGWANPALLTRCDESDDFGLLLPAVGGRAYDETGLVDDIDAFVDAFDAIEANPAGTTQADLDNLADRLQALSGRKVNGEFGTGLVLAMPSKDFAWSLHAHSYADLQAFVDIDPNDITAIQGVGAGNPLPALSSQARIVGVAVSEVGLSLAKRLELAGMALSIGVTPKYQRVDTYNYAVSADNFDADNFDDDQFRNDNGEFNLDAGVAFEPGILPGVTVGLMVRNLRKLTYTTENILGTALNYEIGPQATLGVAWQLGALTLAADADILQLERFKNSDLLAAGQSAIDDVRLLRLGAEIDVLGWLQLRGGYEYDMEDTLNGAISAGLGISPFEVVHIDIAGTYVEGESYGAVAQLALTF